MITSHEKIRIGILMHGIFFGGATRSLFLLLKSLRSEPFEFIIYTIGCNADELRKDLLKYALDLKLVKIKTISVNQIYKQSFITYLINSKIPNKKFIRIILKDQIDILHINTTVFPQLPEQIKKTTGIKVIVHLREWLSKNTDCSVQRYMVGKILEYTDALIAISPNETELFKTHKNLTIIPNPFDFAKTTDIDKTFRETHIIDEETVLISMFSHFAPAKGHRTFIEALILLTNKSTTSQFKFIIVGFRDKRTKLKLLIKRFLFMKDYTSEILNLVQHNQLEDKLIIIPYTNNVFPILHATDIVVRPADSADPWGRDIIEAMAFGKPVIATGTSDFLVRDGITGFLFPATNSVELAVRIETLIQNKPLRKQMGINAFAEIKEKCSILEYAQSVKKVYYSVLYHK